MLGTLNEGSVKKIQSRSKGDEGHRSVLSINSILGTPPPPLLVSYDPPPP